METLALRPLRTTPGMLSLASLALATAMEGLTCGLRFAAHLQSTRDTAALAHWTHGIRIHHGYVGLALLVLAVLAHLPRSWKQVVLVLGAALVLSDLAHHVLVLWPITGSPSFDLRYPAS
jgi:hypothetical protein